MSKHKVREDTDENIIWCTRFACSISKVTRAHKHAQANPPGNTQPHTGTNTYAHAANVIRFAFSTATVFLLRYGYIALSVYILLHTIR